MTHRIRAGLTGLTAAVVLALAVGTASAGHFRLSNNTFRVTWTEFTITGNEGGISVRCPVTLEGSFHSATIAKVALALVGHITRAEVATATCNGGRARALTERLPWHVTYEGFQGTLPNITTLILLVVGLPIEFEPGLGVRCLFESTAENAVLWGWEREAGGAMTSTRFEAATTIPVRRAVGCPERVRLGGTGNPFILGSAVNRIGLTLI